MKDVKSPRPVASVAKVDPSGSLMSHKKREPFEKVQPEAEQMFIQSFSTTNYET